MNVRPMLAALFLVACSSGAPDATEPRSPPDGDAPAKAANLDAATETTTAAEAGVEANPAEPDVEEIAWETGSATGEGVAHKSTANPRGTSAALLYAGFGVDLAAARGWATAVYRAELRDLGVSELWAVQGPDLAQYQNREIGNSKVAAALASKVTGATRFVLVLGHSSGSFVAHELLAELAGGLDAGGKTAGKIVYFDLDGGASGLTAPIVSRLRRAYFVSPYDRANDTRGFNTTTMQRLGATYASAGGFFEVDASTSGCHAGATECVHVSLVNAHPHDSSRAIAAADYGTYDAAHPVNVGYLAAKAAEAGLRAD